MFLLLISLSGLILFKNSDIEYWKDEFVNLFHPSKYSEKSTVQNSDYLTPYQFEPYDEYNLSRAILNVFIYSFEKISPINIIFLSSLDNKYTVVSSTDTIYKLFSSLGVIDNEIELEDDQYQMELILSTKKTIPNSFIQNVEEIISFSSPTNGGGNKVSEIVEQNVVSLGTHCSTSNSVLLMVFAKKKHKKT